MAKALASPRRSTQHRCALCIADGDLSIHPPPPTLTSSHTTTQGTPSCRRPRPPPPPPPARRRARGGCLCWTMGLEMCAASGTLHSSTRAVQLDKRTWQNRHSPPRKKERSRARREGVHARLALALVVCPDRWPACGTRPLSASPLTLSSFFPPTRRTFAQECDRGPGLRGARRLHVSLVPPPPPPPSLASPLTHLFPPSPSATGRKKSTPPR